MNPTNPYWTPDPAYVKKTSLKPITNTLGFQFNLPWPDLSTSGFYYGENPVYGRRQLVYRSDPEYYARQNIIPSIGGVPRVNPYDKIYQFSREKYTVRV
jgi:hypothetical protein